MKLPCKCISNPSISVFLATPTAESPTCLTLSIIKANCSFVFYPSIPNLLYTKQTDYFKMWFWSCCQVTSVVSNSVWPHRWQPTRLPCPWDSPSKNTGVGCHFLLHLIMLVILYRLSVIAQHTQDKIHISWGFPGSLVVKNLLANSRDTRSIPGLGRLHTLCST